jgi:ferric-dicitrate binding protein FerR (iron transport regulator)
MNSKDDQNRDSLLDRAVEQIRADQGEPEAADRAAERVWKRLTAEAGSRIRACADFQQLIPDFAGGRLDEGRRLLVEDHTRECAACRRELMTYRAGATAAAPQQKKRRVGRMAWALAAAAVFVGLAITLAINYSLFLPASGGLLQVAEVDGSLLQVSDDRTDQVSVGSVVQDGGTVRTAQHSGAVLVLADDSQIEMNERSELYVTERGSDSTIHLQRGSIIVQASDQGSGHLNVETNECLVAVTGTVFSVTHGARGSRVSVIEGQVNVDSDAGQDVLHAGDQLNTRAGLDPIPVEADIAWSRDMDQHLALLREFADLRREMAQRLPAPSLRTDTRLLDSAPAGSVIYFAMPNLSETISSAHELLREKVQTSDVLQRWWNENVTARGMEPHIDTLMEKVRLVGEELGPEIAVTLQQGDGEGMESLVLLATLNNPAGFQEVLAAELEAINAQADTGATFYIITDPRDLALADGRTDELIFWIDNDLLAVSPNARALQRMAAVGDDTFAGSPFHRRLASVYDNGTQIVFGADVASLIDRHRGDEQARQAMATLGLDDADFLVLQRRTVNGTHVTNAELSFARQRQGVASWLAKPAPMGVLDFISPEATVMAAFLVRNPADLLTELFDSLSQSSDGFRDSLDRFQSEHGIDLIDDLAAPLGGEFAIALDGPVLPVPAWKVVVEVYDPQGLQRTIERMVDQANIIAAQEGLPPILIETEEINGRRFHHVTSESFDAPFYYTFHDGYLVAGSQAALLQRAIDFRASGITLTRSSRFIELLPPDGRVDFSALIFHDFGPLLEPLLRHTPDGVTRQLTEGQAETMRELLDSGVIGTNLTCVYGENDQISVVNVGQGSIFGGQLGHLLSAGGSARGGAADLTYNSGVNETISMAHLGQGTAFGGWLGGLFSLQSLAN